MNKHWLKLMAPDGDNGGGSAVAEPPAQSIPTTDSTPSPSESLPAAQESFFERQSPITAEAAEKLGITTPRPIEVKPMAALGLEKTSRSAINELIAKDSLKITKSPQFERPVSTPATTTPAPVAKVPASQVPLQGQTVAKPVIAATPAVQAVPKYKVGEREYSPEQMQAIIEQGLLRQQPVQSQVQQPQVPANNRTPEQEREFVRQREQQFVSETAPHIDLNIAGLKVSPEQADILAAGGEAGAALWDQMNQKAVAYATLLARKTIAAEANPIFERQMQAVRQQEQVIAPLLEQARSVAAWETEQEFVKAYPDLAAHIDSARVIGHELVRQYPEWAASVDRPTFIKAVAEQTPKLLERFGVKLGSNPPAQQTNVAPEASQTAKPTVIATNAPAKVATQKGPKPITGQAPGRVPTASSGAPKQTAQGFQKVAVDSISALR